MITGSVQKRSDLAGSAPNRRVQRPCESTTARELPGVASAAVKKRPSRGSTPSTAKNGASTEAPDSRFIAFWELHDGPGAEDYIFDLNKAAKLPPATNHYSFAVSSEDECAEWREKWRSAGLKVFEIDHNWCKSIYTQDPNGNAVEFCLTTGEFTPADRERALAALDETEFKPSPPPAMMKMWEPT